MSFAYIAAMSSQLGEVVALDREIRGKNLEMSRLQQKLREASGGVTSAISKQHGREDMPDKLEDRAGGVRVGAQVVVRKTF